MAEHGSAAVNDGETGPQQSERHHVNNDNNAKSIDPELFCCLLQPATADTDPQYIGMRRLLLHRKAEAGDLRRLDWRCNGKTYVAYRNYISRPRNWERDSSRAHSLQSTPGNSNLGTRLLAGCGKHAVVKEVMIVLRSYADLQNANPVYNHRSSFGSTASDSDRPKHRGAESAYSFVGMHCIFDKCKTAVTVLKFGHMSSELLAYGAADGTLTVCSVSENPSVIKQLEGHSKDVTDFDFSSNNQYIASSSLDKTVRVWEIAKEVLIAILYAKGGDKIDFPRLKMARFFMDRENDELDRGVTSLDHDHTGLLIFCGDAQGCIYSVNMNSHTGVLSRSHHFRNSSRQKSPVTTVQYRSFSLLAGGPVLLTCTQDGNLSFFSVALEINGYLSLRCSLKLAPRIRKIQASFCPLLSLEKGEFIVAGSEDSNVYFYDLTRPKNTCVNKLQGHRFPVMGIAWNHGENLLASSDFFGVVIVWKRERTNQKKNIQQ
ncbi:unnamed protein product [Sphenostylis stenocarpa]|uniref:WD repeat-containing protein 13 n=1 Tax=Sphenostylis stenocarpa TaxID=92480 RepID=A0AA86W3Y0_9FABA|nr:unnamed protein product [Sphenostylis stenocarpa]